MDTFLRRFASSDAVTDGFVHMGADFRIEFGFRVIGGGTSRSSCVTLRFG